jgi:hypothetical protein
MTSNLVPKPITDKNGVTKTHWVKPDSNASSATRIPVPKLAFSRRAEAERLRTEIMATVIQKMRNNPRFHSYWPDEDYNYLDMLVAEGRYEVLAVAQQELEKDSFYSPSRVGFIFWQLKRRGFENIAELVNEETLSARKSLVQALNAYGMKNGIPHLSARDDSEDVYQMAFTDLEDVPLILDIIKDRGVMAPERYRALLSEMRKDSFPLGRGML